MMTYKFWKMNGAGNDFVVINDLDANLHIDKNCVAKIAEKISCEGVIFLQPSDVANFKMRFFNPDGNEAEMCGNGARCVARLAYDLKAAPKSMQIETVAGILKALVFTDSVEITMTDPQDMRLNIELPEIGTVHFINSGVPHVVVIVSDLAEIDVKKLGEKIRYHEAFAPAGTNVNFVEAVSHEKIWLKTYERGVEAETGACGTGAVASALICKKLGMVRVPTIVQCFGGVLEVNASIVSKSEFVQVTLRGPAVYEFEGEVQV